MKKYYCVFPSHSFIHSFNIKKKDEHPLWIKHCARCCGCEEKEDKASVVEESAIYSAESRQENS